MGFFCFFGGGCLVFFFFGVKTKNSPIQPRCEGLSPVFFFSWKFCSIIAYAIKSGIHLELVCIRYKIHVKVFLSFSYEVSIALRPFVEDGSPSSTE